MNEIVTRSRNLNHTVAASPVTEVAPLTSADVTRLSVLANVLEQTPDGRWEISDSALPSRADRHWLEDRQLALQRSLTKPSPRAAAAVIAGMFLRFPASASAPDQEVRIAAYAADLGSLPLWAVERAAQKVRGHYAPPSHEFADAVRRECEPAREELSKIRRILNAEVYHLPSEDERTRVEAGFQSLLARLKSRQSSNPSLRPVSTKPVPTTQRQAEDWLAAQAANPSARSALSEEALRMVGAYRGEIAAE